MKSESSREVAGREGKKMQSSLEGTKPKELAWRKGGMARGNKGGIRSLGNSAVPAIPGRKRMTV